jgi:hypothetical protein
MTKNAEEADYVVKRGCSFHRGNLTKKEAVTLARRMQEQLDAAGSTEEEVEVYDPQGAPVPWRVPLKSEIIDICRLRTTLLLGCRRCTYWMTKEKVCPYQQTLEKRRVEWRKETDTL